MTTAASISPALEKAYEANIRRFYTFSFLTEFQLWLPIWVLYLIDERGFSLVHVTVLEACHHLVIVLAEMPTGAVADRWGRKTSLLLGVVMGTISIALYALVAIFPLIVVCYIGWGIAFAFFSGADKALLYDSLAGLGREADFLRIYGRTRAIGVAAVCSALLVGAPLAAATSLATPILAGAAVVGLSGIVCLGFKEPERHAEAPRLPYFQIIRAAVLHIAQSRSLRAMLMLQAIFIVAAMPDIFIQPFLAENGAATGELGLFMVAATIFAVGGALAAHRLRGLCGERATLIGLTAIWTAALFLLGFLPGLLAFVAFPIIYFCQSTTTPLVADFVNRNSPQHLRASVASVTSMAGSFAIVAGNPVFGLIAEAGSLQHSFVAAGLVVAVLGPLALLIWISAMRDERKDGDPRPHLQHGEA